MNAKLITALIVQMIAFMWVRKWKLYFDSSMVLMKAKSDDSFDCSNDGFTMGS